MKKENTVLVFEMAYLFLDILFINLSYDVASGSDITPCIKICKPLVVYRFSGNTMKLLF